jgi:MerR family redox-sensitive transcriptional activator SoxR
MDWQRLGRSLRTQIDEKIQLLTRTRGKLDQCIGCGCLSLAKCQLYNKDDRAAAGGPGPRFVLE